MRAQLKQFSSVAELDLIAHGTTSDAETIKDTAVAQPLIVAAGLSALTALNGMGRSAADGFSFADVAAGHSVGEFTAAAGAGVLTPAEAIGFVSLRGRAMASAAAQESTGMSAVLGGAEDDVLAALSEHGLTPANMNSKGQIVAAGSKEALTALGENPPPKSRVMPLAVAGAFHTEYMSSAQAALSQYSGSVNASDPHTTLLSNADGAEVERGPAFVESLIRQVANPVRWDLCMGTMAELGITGLIEVAPAGTLANLAKRSLKGVELLSLNSPADLDAAQEMIKNHSTKA